MQIKSENKYKLNEGKLLAYLDGKNNTLLKRFSLFWNTALNGVWCHNKSFGTPDDYTFGSDVGMTSQFYIEEGYMSLSCYAYGGMTGLEFNALDIDEVSNEEEKSLMVYTINYLEQLFEADIIERPSGWYHGATLVCGTDLDG